MKNFAKAGGLGVLLGATMMIPRPAVAQTPVTPVVVDLAAPIVVNAVKPKPKPTGLVKFQGYVQNANIAQITLRAKGNETNIQTFTLSTEMSAKMQKIVDQGGFQYGDKVTILYDPTTMKAMKFKGKASKPV